MRVISSWWPGERVSVICHIVELSRKLCNCYQFCMATKSYESEGEGGVEIENCEDDIRQDMLILQPADEGRRHQPV